MLVFNSVHCARCPYVSFDPEGPRGLLNVLCHVRIRGLPGPLLSSSPRISHQGLGGSWWLGKAGSGSDGTAYVI